ncbi:MAG: DUF2085 domain-containing protein [Bacteroidetes bacterium]|jgi:uncharacterized membrane protein|nr:DUF2085 domain-containing protein [Bacteroidota bacterium]
MIPHRTILVVFFLAVLFWCAGFLLLPFITIAGFVSSEGYAFYGRVCHQIDARSWHVGTEPFGVCIRCSAIYLGALVSLFVMLLVREPDPRVARWAFLVTIAAVAVDVGLDLLGVASNTELSRSITGGLAGVAAPWFVMPLFVDAVQQLLRKRVQSQQGDVIHVRETE